MLLSRPACLPAILALGALAALTGGCAKKPLPVVKADPAEVEYAGCYEVQRAGPVCYLGKSAPGRKLSLHPVGRAERYEIRANGNIVPARIEEGPDGPIFHLTVPDDAAKLELRASTQPATRVWELRIAVWPARPPWIERAWTLAAQGGQGLAAARELIDREIGRCTQVEIRLVALARRAQLEPGQAGQSAARTAAFQRALAAYREAGYLQGEVFLATGLAFELVQQHDFGLARATLEGVSLPPFRPVEAAQNLAYSKGLLARRIGDYRTAIGEFETAAELSGKIGLRSAVVAAQQEEALTLTQLGRFADAERLLGKLTGATSSDLAPCDRALALTNRGWARYLGIEAGDWNLGDPIATFAEARHLYADNQECEFRPRRLLNLQVNLALALLQADRTREAEATIQETASTAASAGPLERMWWLDLRARLALKQKNPGRALALYRELDATARASLSQENQWRAAFGQAQALAALHRSPEAAAALAAADTLVDLQLSRVPLGGGRESFSDQWSAASRLYVEILVRAGKLDLALQVARRARSRVLTQLAESARLEALSADQRRARDSSLGAYWRLRDDIDRISAESWRQPKAASRQVQSDLERRLRDAQAALDRVLGTLQSAVPGAAAQPRRLQPGELLLAYFPLSSERTWVAFSDDGTSIAVRELSLPAGSLTGAAEAATLSRLLLEPFKERIAAARRLVLLPYGRLRAVDFQALPFGDGGRALLSDRPVVYGLDIPSRPEEASAEPLRAVIVADSREDLPEARQEGRDLQALLARLRPRWNVRLLEGRDATAEAVRAAISGGVDLLHYAGHADFSGQGGWESQIPLAQRSRLTLGDILTLARQPRWVVLSGCETGASDTTAQVESQGLAHAFLLGGSRAVVAATRKVDDRVAHQLVLEMYRQLGSTPDLAALLQQAQKSLRKRGVSQREWSSFRVFEP